MPDMAQIFDKEKILLDAQLSQELVFDNEIIDIHLMQLSVYISFWKLWFKIFGYFENKSLNKKNTK